jgi:ABC-2 type transport system ATP-binding protein
MHNLALYLQTSKMKLSPFAKYFSLWYSEISMTNTLPPAIEIQGITKQFGQILAVNDVNLTIPRGTIFALIGPNGAGKTTLIKMLVGLTYPTHGLININGVDIIKNPINVKKAFGYVTDDPEMYEFLTGFEFLNLTGNLRKIDPKKLSKRIEHLSGIFPFDQTLNDQISSYSRGNKQKLAFLGSILDENVNLLIIDEPIIGLDPTSVDIFGKMLTEFTQKVGTVFFATHSLFFAQKYALYAGLMRQGKLIKEFAITKKTDLEKIYRKNIFS